MIFLPFRHELNLEESHQHVKEWNLDAAILWNGTGRKVVKKATQLGKCFLLMWLGKVHEAHIDAIVLIFGPFVISEDPTLELIISWG